MARFVLRFLELGGVVSEVLVKIPAKLVLSSSSIRALSLPLGLAGVIGVSLGACSVSVGEGDPNFDFDGGARVETGTPTPPKNDSGVTVTPPGNQACNSCLFQGCSGQHAVCQGNSECIAIYQCATKTGCDQACVNECFNAHPSGQKEYTALYTCDQDRTCSSCQTECNATQCPAPVDAGPVDSGTEDAIAPVSCSGCTSSKCSGATAACAPGTDCDQYSQCIILCSDASCADTCGVAHPQGKAASESLASCTTSQCATECGL